MRFRWILRERRRDGSGSGDQFGFIAEFGFMHSFHAPGNRIER
jgi:hypothetical protein